ncbi:MAG TPA: TerC family protein [Chloroflexia bacterium]|nr:TerC family protein [Chloroflexia bacterium]
MVIDMVWLWVLFNIGVLVMLAIDLGVFHKDDKPISVKEALIWSAIWIVVAAVFNVGVWIFMGEQKGLEFLTGYVIERSLSIDNIFVFILVFTYFAVLPRYQYKVLFWGIIGALVMRAALILLGTALVTNFHWVLYIFGALLVISGIRMAFQDDTEVHPDQNPVVRLFTRFMPVSKQYDNGNFFTRIDGKRLATPLLIVLIVVETTDLVFAFDSIPAIFAITTDPFIVYTSNVFAILGLRAMYFALAGVMDRFHYLKFGLSMVLVFIGAKMLLDDFFHIDTLVSLGVVAVILTISVIVSLMRPPKLELPRKPGEPGDLAVD